MNNKLRELKVTIPADKKSRESVAAGYVTDNNSGGYFVIECQECGAVYPSQHADGGGQIADTGDYNDAICPHCGEEGPEECENVGLAWNVQQAKIIALLAELEAKDKRISELELDELAMRASSRAVHEAQDKHIAELENESLVHRHRAYAAENKVTELQAKLATPVRLPEKYNMKMAGDKSTKSMFYGHNSAINDSAKAIRAAGFKCVGDEQ